MRWNIYYGSPPKLRWRLAIEADNAEQALLEAVRIEGLKPDRKRLRPNWALAYPSNGSQSSAYVTLSEAGIDVPIELDYPTNSQDKDRLE